MMSEPHEGKPSYVHESGNYFIYWQEYYQNWHAWVELGSLYAGFFAYGLNAWDCPEDAHWQEMIDGEWV